MLIRQLRILASSDAEAAKFDREKWRSQVSPYFTSFSVSNLLAFYSWDQSLNYGHK
jgi:hypothetical protein